MKPKRDIVTHRGATLPPGTDAKQWGPVIYLGRPSPPIGYRCDWSRGDRFDSAALQGARTAIAAPIRVPTDSGVLPKAEDGEVSGD